MLNRDEDEYQRWRSHGHEKGWLDRGMYEYTRELQRTYGRQYESQAYGRQVPIERWTLSGTEFGDFGTKQSHSGRGPRSYQRNDERIREDVVERLTRHHDIDASDVEVEVNGGEVLLKGMVESRWEKRLAEDICEDIFGVKNTRNQLKVRHMIGFGSERQSESQSPG